MSGEELIKIKESICEKYGLTLGDFIGLLFIRTGQDYYKLIGKFLNDGIITPIYRNMEIVNYSLLDEGLQLVDTIILESGESVSEDVRMENLAVKLKEIFPGGKKDGTALYWRGNTQEIKNRLIMFFKRYGKFDDDEIIDAAQRYVDFFKNEGSFQNMRLLKYFIWKKENKHGEIEESSDLMAFLENKESDNDNIINDWNVELR